MTGIFLNCEWNIFKGWVEFHKNMSGRITQKYDWNIPELWMDLPLQTSGTMETNWIRKLFEPSPVPILYVGKIEDLLGQVPLSPCFLDRSTTSTNQHKFADRSRPLHSAVLTDQARDLAGAAWVTLTRSTPGCGTLAGPSLELAGFW